MVQIVTPHQALPEPLPAIAPDPELPPLRKVQPAYGRQLLERRRFGEHPPVINVVYGERWRDVSWPKVAVLPAKYRPGAVDWRVVAGVKALVFDLAAGLADFDVAAGHYGPLYTLLGELVAIGAYVAVRYPEYGRWVEQDVDSLAFACRWRRQWPSWWSDDLDQRQKSALSGWLADQERAVLRKSERGREE